LYLVYSFKTILFISTTVLSTTAYSTFLFPALFTDFFDFYVISSILSTSVLVLTQKQSAGFQNTFSDTIILSSQYQPLVFLHKDFSLKSLTIFLPSIDFFFNLLNFIIIFFFIDLFQNIFLSSNKSFFWFKPFNFLKTSFFLSYTFMTSIDALVSFTYFFFSLYFLELHFFFIFTFNLTSDSIVYQFNFLLSSFFFIFLVKTIRTLFEKGFLFSMNFHFNEFFVFNSSKVAPLTLSLKAKTSFFEEDDLLTISRFFLRIFFFVFFFFSTFFVWLLRFIIQFVRLLVLFMIHTIFELVIVSADTILTSYFLNYLFFFKYLFFIFFFFGSFLYLIIYLNLMFTLQVFIFYFFSEVFQSNFITDLSSFVATKIKKL
jgi:hypothetical protein